MLFKTCDQEQKTLFPAAIGDLVPQDHLARVVSETIDQLEIRAFIEKYSLDGQHAFHPRMMLKVLFYGYAVGIRSSRKLADAIQLNVPFMWLAAGNQPDFRTIALFRKKHIGEMEDLFVQVVRICCEMGMVKVGNWSIDGTHIKASANINKSRTRDTIDAAIDRLRREIAEDLAAAACVDDAEDALHGSSQTGTELPRNIRNQQQRLARLEQATKTLDEHPHRNTANSTDPDAAVMRKRGSRAKPAYNAQATVDTDSGVILALGVGTNPADNAELIPQVDQATANVGQPPERVSADAGYTSGVTLEALEARGIEAYIPQGERLSTPHMAELARSNPAMAAVMALVMLYCAMGAQGKTLDDIPFGRDDFVWNADADCYICPAGEQLVRGATVHNKTACGEYDSVKYVRQTKDCIGCPFAHRCLTPGAKTRVIKRSEHEERARAMAARLATPEGKEIYGKRQCSVEPVFGVMKEVMGFCKFLLRGLDAVVGEFALAGAAFNIRKIFSHCRSSGAAVPVSCHPR